MGKHDHKRSEVERLLDEGQPVTLIAKATGIPLGSMSYFLAKWQLLDRQVRATRHFTERGSKSVSEKLKHRHEETGYMSGENHWSHGLLKLHGKFVPEEDVRTTLEELLESDPTIAQMAEQCGVDSKTITNWLKKFGLQRGMRNGERCSWYRGGWRKERGPDWLGLREQILERDGYRCIHCGITQEEARTRGHPLSVHHIVPWRETHDNSPENLLTLCQSCHLIMEWQSGIFRGETYGQDVET